MNKIKFLKEQIIKVNGLVYKPYLIGDLPPSFGYAIHTDKDTDGISKWFNRNGLTYVISK